MTDPYTPTTEDVRGDYIALASIPSERMGSPLYPAQVARNQFDRWLAQHDAQVAAQALEDAVRYARPDAGDHVGMTRSEAEAFEDALTLVEEYAARLIEGVEG